MRSRGNLELAAEQILKEAENVQKEVLEKTPARFAKAWMELLCGYKREEELQELLTTFETEGAQHLVVMRKIPFYSICEHHLLPFWGLATVGYIPRDKIFGASKLVRVVEIYSRRLQLQERLTAQIADALEKHLNPLGVAVVLTGEHMCMAMRGVGKVGVEFIISEMRGAFRDEQSARAEFLTLHTGG